jgi:hypothetical protein
MRSEVPGSKFKIEEALMHFSLCSERRHESLEDNRAKSASWDYAMECAIIAALHHSSTTIGPYKWRE